MSYNFKQYDSRWARKPYCHATMASDGCGPTSVADIVYNLDKKITPWKVAQWMTKNGYSTYTNGTLHSGITAALKHYGFNVLGVDKTGKGDISMTKFLSEMAKGDRWGIILFTAGTKGGVTWTMGGHYMAAVDYKVVNGKHYLYMYDSGTRGHNGWYCFETTMKGMCERAYIASKPKPAKKPTPVTPKPEPPKPVTPPAPPKVVYSKTALANDMRKLAKKYASDNSFHYKKWEKDEKTHMCPVCHPELQKTPKYKGWNCIGWASFLMYHIGIKDVKCSCNGIGDDAFFTKLLVYANKGETKKALQLWKSRNGDKWEIVYNKGNRIPQSQLKAMDILLSYSGKEYKHTSVMYNSTHITDATSGKTQISIRKYTSLGYPCKLAFRPTYTKKIVK